MPACRLIPILVSAPGDPVGGQAELMTRQAWSLFLVLAVGLGLFLFVVLLLMVRRRQRRAAEAAAARRDAETPPTDAWAEAGRRARPYPSEPD